MTRRAALILGAALVISAGLVQAAEPGPVTLPRGALLTFVTDDAVTVATVRPGGTFRAHLRDELALDETILAPAGTTARLTIVDTAPGPGGAQVRIALSEFRIKGGLLAVAPLQALVTALPVATVIPAHTMGSVEREPDGRIIIRIPPPFALSDDAPNAFFSPVAARTPGTVLDDRRGRGRRAPSPSPSPSPTPG